MIYHVLLIVNHTPYGLMIETEHATPSPKVLEAATLAFEVHDYTGLKVLADRGDVFGQRRHFGPYLESELIKWIESGQSSFAWSRFMQRKPLHERKDHEQTGGVAAERQPGSA